MVYISHVFPQIVVRLIRENACDSETLSVSGLISLHKRYCKLEAHGPSPCTVPPARALQMPGSFPGPLPLPLPHVSVFLSAQRFSVTLCHSSGHIPVSPWPFRPFSRVGALGGSAYAPFVGSRRLPPVVGLPGPLWEAARPQVPQLLASGSCPGAACWHPASWAPGETCGHEGGSSVSRVG